MPCRPCHEPVSWVANARRKAVQQREVLPAALLVFLPVVAPVSRQQSQSDHSP